MRRKRKARHAFSGKPVPNPLPRAAFVGKSQAISESGAARPGDSQGRDLTHERVGEINASPAPGGERRSGPRLRRLLAGPWGASSFCERDRSTCERDQWFESILLQRGVRCELDLGAGGFADCRRASWSFTKDRMGRAELLALMIKVLKLIAPIALALSLLARTAPDACARGHGHSIMINLL